jgi:predicted enzyme involved in methoxymalonyl-ACP biosynthesis
MGRGVETALLAHLIEEARSAGAQRLLGTYIPTAKNVVVRDCYAHHGFQLLDTTGEGQTSWQYDVTAEQLLAVPAWLTVRTSASSIA